MKLRVRRPKLKPNSPPTVSETHPPSRFLRCEVSHSKGRHPVHISTVTGRIHGLDGNHGWRVGQGPRKLRKSVAAMLAALPVELRKARADWKNDPSYRWITMHSGDDHEGRGVPVLVKVHPDGSAHVVGGAGGSMTGLTLTRLRSPEELKVEAKERATKREAAEERRKASMSTEELQTEQQHKEDVSTAVEETKAKTLAEVAQALGWDADVKLAPEIAANMDSNQVARLERRRQKHLLREVEKAVEAIQDEVIQQHNEQVAQVLGDVPIEQLLTPEVDASGKGYADAISSLAAENGLTTGDIKHTQTFVTDDRLATAEALGYIKSAQKARDFIDGLHAAGAAAREADRPYIQAGVTKPRVDDARDAVRDDPERAKAVLLAYQKLKEVRKQAAALEAAATAQGGMDQAAIKRGVALLTQSSERLTEDQLAEAAEQALTQKAMIDAVSGLVEEVEDFEEAHGSVEKHIMGSRFAQLSALYQRVTHEPLPIDRRVADLLGVDAASQLAAEMIRQRTGSKSDDARNALVDAHVKTQTALSDKAVESARAEIDEANKLLEGLPDLATADADDLLLIQSQNQERIRRLEHAGEIMGRALGQLEAGGHLNNSMQGKLKRTIDISMGPTSTADVMRAVSALGLEQGEYSIEADGANRFLHVLSDVAMQKLVEKPDPEVARDYADSQAIKRGDQDEEGWLPKGVNRRAATDYHEGLQQFTPGDVAPELKGVSGRNMESAVEDYVGRSLAENGAGSLHEIRNRLLDPAWRVDNVDPEQQDLVASIAATVLDPKTVDDRRKSVALAERLIGQATAHDPSVAPLDNQSIHVDQQAYEAMHHALAEFPKGKLAFTPQASLTRQDTAALRRHFYEDLMGMKDPKEVRKAREKLQEKLDKVVATREGLFGAEDVKYSETPAGQKEWQEFEAEHGDALDPQKVNAWEHYSVQMRGMDKAYEALQESVRGRLMEGFSKQYSRLTGQQLRSGQAPLRNAVRHKIGTMSADEYATFTGGEVGKTHRENLAADMNRVVAGSGRGGQFATGSVKARLARAAEAQEREATRMFSGQTGALPSRFTIGKVAEQQAERVWSHLAPNFAAGKPMMLPTDVNMSGKLAPQQRAVKLVERMGRVGLHTSTGSGKSLMGLGSFSDLESQGKVKRGIFVVPPKQTGQWGQEATRFMEAGKYNHVATGGMSADQRRSAYADQGKQMVMVGHQALRDDLTWAVAKHFFAGDELKARRALLGGPDQEADRHKMVQEAAKREGWNFDFSMMDEGHDALNRRGKPNSRLANVLDGFMAPHKYHVNATATAVKNDVSEAFDLLHKLRPDRYPREAQGGFMRKFGSVPIESVQEALRREVAPYFYSHQVDTGVKRNMHSNRVPMTPVQKARYREVHRAYLDARQATPGAPEHRAAVLKLFPKSELAGLSEAEKTAAVERSTRFLHSRRDAMLNRVVYGHDEGLKPEDIGGFQEIVKIAKQHARDDHDSGQAPGVVFAHNPGVGRKLKAHLEAQGLRVGVIDGTSGDDDVEDVRNGFFPQVGWDKSDPATSAAKMRKAAKYDVILASDAASAGFNFQRGKWLVNYDPPNTAKTWQQRNGRIDRIGGLHDEAHFYDLDHDAPVARRQAEILRRKHPITGTFQGSSELLDQDNTGQAGQIAQEREANLARAVEPHQQPLHPSEESQQAAAENAAAEAAGQTGMF